MSLDAASQLGSMLGKLANEQNEIKQNMSPSDEETQDQMVALESVVLGGSATVSKYLYPTDSFILDHAQYGEIDSSVLKLDGGYYLWNELLAAWNLNGDANDSSGQGYNGTVTGATEIDGEYYLFDGDDKIECATFPTITGAFTVSCWIKPTEFSDWQSIVGKIKYSTNDSGWAVYLNSSGNINVDIGNGTRDRWTNITSIPLNEWTHVASVYTGTQVIMYVNTVAIAHATAISSPTSCTDVFGIGKYADYAYFKGAIDAVYIHNRALSQQEIEHLYNSGTVLEYPFKIQLQTQEF